MIPIISADANYLLRTRYWSKEAQLALIAQAFFLSDLRQRFKLGLGGLQPKCPEHIVWRCIGRSSCLVRCRRDIQDACGAADPPGRLLAAVFEADDIHRCFG